MPGMPEPTDDDNEYPTQPERLGDAFASSMPWLVGLPRYADDPAGFVAEFKRRAMAAQAAGNRRSANAFAPAVEDPVPAAAREQEVWEAIVGPQLATWRLGNLTDHAAGAVPALERWIERGNGPLLIAGGIGSGKTAAACATAHRWRGGVRPVVLAPLQTVLDTFERPHQGEADQVATLRRRLGNVGSDTLVILDDLAPTAGYPSQVGALTGLVDQLVRSRCRLIVTTNLDKKERQQHLDGRLRSRVEGGASVVPVNGADLRGLPIPDAPPTGPCPFHCEPPGVFAMGALARCELPGVAELTVEFIEQEMQHPGPAPYYGHHRPSAEDYAEVGPAEAERYLTEAWQRWDQAFDWHEKQTGYWCPHCRPEKTRHGSWLIVQLRELGHL